MGAGGSLDSNTFELISQSFDELNDKQKLAAISASGLSKEMKNQIKVGLNLNTATNAASGAFGIFQRQVDGIKGAFSGLAAIIKANPWIIAVAAVAAAGVAAKKIYDELNVTVEEQTAKVESLKSGYETLKQEIESLSGKNNRTTYEDQHLRYLERRLELDKQILKTEQAQLYREQLGFGNWTDAFDKDSAAYDVNQQAAQNVLDSYNLTDIVSSILSPGFALSTVLGKIDESVANPYSVLESNIEETLGRISYNNDVLDRLYEERDKIATDDTTAKFLNKQTIELTLDAIKTSKAELQEYVNEAEEDLSTLYANIALNQDALTSGLFSENDEEALRQQLDTWKSQVDSLESWMSFIAKEAPDVVPEMFGGTAFEAIAKNAEEMKTFDEAISDAVSSYSELDSLLASQDAARSVELTSEQFALYGSAIENVNGVMQLNAEKAREIAKAKLEEQIAAAEANKKNEQSRYIENSKKIELYTKALAENNEEKIDCIVPTQDLINSLRQENDQILANCNQYDYYCQVLREASGEYQNWLASQNASTSGTMYSDAEEAIKAIREAQEEGRIGSGNTVYTAALDFVVPEEISSQGQAAINKYLARVEKYITEKDADGINAFLAEAMNKGLVEGSKGIPERIAEGVTIKDFADRMEIGEDMARAILGQLGEYWDLNFAEALDPDEAYAQALLAVNTLKKNINMGVDVEVSQQNLDEAEKLLSELSGKLSEKVNEALNSEPLQEYIGKIKEAEKATKEVLNELDKDDSLILGQGELEAANDELDATIAKLKEASGLTDIEIQAFITTGEQQLTELEAELKVTPNDKDLQEKIATLTENLDIAKKLIVTESDETLETKDGLEEIESFTINDKTFTVTANTSAALTAIEAVKLALNSLSNSDYRADVSLQKLKNAKGEEGPQAASGGRFFTDEPVLVGEEGPEIVVDKFGGSWYTVGDNGAEFVRLPDGALVFDAEKSKKLLSRGFVGARGTALAGGTAMAGANDIYVGGSNTSGKKIGKSVNESSYSKAAKAAKDTAKAAKDAADSMSDVAEESENILDHMQQQIDVVDKTIQSLTDNMEAVVGYQNKNSFASSILTQLQAKIDLYSQMYDIYMQEANSVGLADEYVRKIQEGAMEIERISDETLYKQIQDYQQWYEEAENCESQIHDLRDEVDELKQTRLDNITNQFEELNSRISRCIDTQEQLIELATQAGDEVDISDYESLIDYQTRLAESNSQAYAALKKEMQSLNLEENTEQWNDCNEQLHEYYNNIVASAQAVEDYKDSMVELTYKVLDDFQSKLEMVNNTISTMHDLIGSDDLVGDDGELTDRGLAQVALYAQEMANAKQSAAEYEEAIESLDDMLSEGLLTEDEYNEKLVEYRSAQESAVLATKEAQDAILSLVKEGIQAEIDAKGKQIDAIKAELAAEKELNEYKQSISDKTKQMAVLEARIAALRDSTSRADLAQRLEYEEELAKLQEELFQEQYDYNMDEKEEALDKELDAFTEEKEGEMAALDTNLAQQQAAIEEYLAKVQADYSTVYAVLDQYGSEYNLSATDDLTNPWSSGSDAAFLCADAIGDAVATINYELSNIDTSPIYELVEALKSIGISGTDSGSGDYEDITGEGEWKKTNGRWWYGNSNDDYVSDGYYNINGKTYGFGEDGYMMEGWNDEYGDWHYFEPGSGEMVKSAWRTDKKGKYYYLTSDGSMARDAAIKAKDGSGYYYVDEDGVWDGATLSYDEVKQLGYPIAYKKGTRRAKGGFALTDEEGLGSELIASNGVLRQLEYGDHVFSADQVAKLYDWSKGMGSLNLNNDLTGTPTSNNIKAGTTVAFNAPLMSLQDVTGISTEYIDAKCDELQRNMPSIIDKAIKYGTI